jgi:hypothetical protein
MVKGSNSLNALAEVQEGLKPYQRVDPQLRRLQRENLALKKLVAEKELMIAVKDELLKKTQLRERTD